MIRELRRQFNARFTPELYQRFLTRLDQRCSHPRQLPEQRLRRASFPAELLRRVAAAGSDLILQLTDNPEYLAAADARIPRAFRVPKTDPRPLFIQADFGLVKDSGGNYQPKLVEIQGFPSLYAYQVELAKTYNEVYGLNHRFLLPPLEESSHVDLLTRALLNGQCDPRQWSLKSTLESEKSYSDFLLTEHYCGIPTVDILEVRKRGSRLFYERHGREIPIHRIYNRAIVDELVRKQITPAFDLRDDLQVEWAGHPNWFFRISKFSLPYLNHRSVPRSQFLSEVQELPAPPEQLVLKLPSSRSPGSKWW